MNKYETNIFPIENCNELLANYRLFEIVGLLETNVEYEQNIQHIIKKLSYALSHPVTVISKLCGDKEKDFLVIKDDEAIAAQIPNSFQIKKGDEVYFRPTKDVVSLNFDKFDDATREICRRFLQFSINNTIKLKSDLWSPGAGKPFFSKKYRETVNGIDIFNGFLPRIVELPNKGWGIEIGLTKKYVSSKPLSVYISREEFDNERKKGNDNGHFIYHYGNTWYEVRIDEWSDLNANQYPYTRVSDNKKVTVTQDLRDLYKGQGMPPEIASLPDDVSLLIYRNNQKEERRIPSALCYRVYDTEELGTLHDKSIIPPFYRRRLTAIVRKKYFQNIKFGDTILKISDKPFSNEIQVFDFPDQKFGNNNVISVKKTKGAIPVEIYNVGHKRNNLLHNPSIGCFDNRPFEAQYFFMPESIINSFGNIFLKDLKGVVNTMHPTKSQWNPKVIGYDDRNYKNSVELAIEIMGKVKEHTVETGFAVIMLPSLKNKRSHDDLAAICVSQCCTRDIPIQVSIMHTDILRKCFRYNESNGYSIYDEKMGLYRGYLRGVALNKVILNNNRSPFVLSTPLHSDLTIGIDVKKKVAGYIFIDKECENIRPHREKSNNKEQLSTNQVFKVFYQNITALAKYSVIHNIVIHRDGRIFKTELNGINKAIDLLKEKEILPENVKLTIVEIPKYSVISLRLFDVMGDFNVFDKHIDNNMIFNPKVGSWIKINNKEGFIATTGREFKHKGSSKPLYIKKILGDMTIENLLEDVYFLSTLSHTKPDDCSRNPLTIGMADRLINDFGGGFDEEEYELQKSLNEEEL